MDGGKRFRILGSEASFSCSAVHRVANQHVKQQHRGVQSARSVKYTIMASEGSGRSQKACGRETNMQQIVA